MDSYPWREFSAHEKYWIDRERVPCREQIYFYSKSLVLVLENLLSCGILIHKKLPNEEMMNSFKC